MQGLMTLLQGLPGARPVGLPPGEPLRVHTDTRSLRAGDLFVALRGERFDAHDFLPSAQAAGAVAALAERGLAEAGLPGVEVPDSRAALATLAARWRAGFSLPLIAVTGSNGKTTVTQMLAALLRADAGQAHTLATQGNLNNDIGVPLTLLRLRPEHRHAVVELGMNHPGEIEYLARIAQPTVALVNNAQREHQEFMGTVQAVAAENGAVLASLGANGVAVFPSDDTFTPLWRTLAGAARVLSFSDTDPQADVHLRQAQWQDGAWQLHARTPAGDLHASVALAGRHNLRNALAAVACALAAGVPLDAVARGLASFQAVAGRSRVLQLPVGGPSGPVLTLVDDTYNANPDSVLAAIDLLAELPGPHLLVLGDMGEVGEQGLAFHLEVLRHARHRGLTAVYCAGQWMAQATAALQAAGEPAPTHWPEVAELAAALPSQLAGVRSVLVKGSRFMRMERVVQALQAPFNPSTKDAHAA